MKVFAEYFVEGGVIYRRNTLLQFGDCWDLIGSAVLANPGSAEPTSLVSEDLLASISKFHQRYKSGEGVKSDHWHEFSPDSTMRFVEKIFNGWYLDKNIDLSGVVQLFNTFNVKNQNLPEAVAGIGEDSELLFSRSVYRYFNDKPTYFGFSNEVLGNEMLRKVAVSIFNNSSYAVLDIYDRDFSKNSFYHPMYVNRAYAQSHFQKYKNSILAGIVENA